MIICIVAFSVVFGVCLWQDDAILRTVNKPLADVANKKPCDETRDPLEQTNCWQHQMLGRRELALPRSSGRQPLSACMPPRQPARNASARAWKSMRLGGRAKP